MLWVKAFHIIFMVCWFAGLFYLPRLFVYHAMTEDQAGRERFCIMERKLFLFVTPFAVITIALGIWMLIDYAWAAWSHSGWLHAKLFLVTLLVVYHGWCWRLLQGFRQGRNRHSPRWYRVFNELPVLILFAVVLLAVVKPF